MSTDQKNNLFVLIQSLTKSEKRQFKLFSGRLDGNSNANFIVLFNLLDKMKVYDEGEIIRKTAIKKTQLSNTKANLYRQILVSLRLTPQQQTTQIIIREQLDFGTILYNKGLYQQSLKVLDKAKKMAIENEENNIAFEIVEFEKVIETQYITRSLSSRADDLAILTKELGIKNVLASKLSNLSLQGYSYLLKNGYAKSEEDYQRIKTYFDYHIPSFDMDQLGFREKLYLYMAQLWYSFIIQDFKSSYKNAYKWVALFDSNPKMIQTNPVFFLKGNNYLLESLYYLRYTSKFDHVLNTFKQALQHKDFRFNDNTILLRFLYLRYNEINLHFLKGTFKEGIETIPEIEIEIDQYHEKIDAHHIMVFYYKFACLHFGDDDHVNCIQYLDKIVKNKELGMREDLMCYARILRLISHYELGRDGQIEALIRSTFKFLLKMNDMHRVQAEIIVFIRSLKTIYPHELKDAFKLLHGRLKQLEDHPFEKRSFLYLDIISWLECKIDGKPIQEIVAAKAKLMK
ncbi:MAG: hypothetical protein GQ574_27885 [Crocinitomix sp.]|nr:hypothetical protein [Crocinitomix sp.]